MRPAFTLLLYSFRSMTRYRSEFYGSLTTPLFLALPAVLIGYWGEQLGLLEAFAQATGTARYLVYILLGAVYWNYVEAVWSIAFSLRGAMRSGVLEALLVTGLSRLGMIGGWSGARLLGVTVHSALAIALVIGLAGWPGGATVGKLLLVWAFSLVGSYGLAFFLFGLTLRFKDAESLLSLVGNVAPLLGGVFFPIAFLPGFLRPVSLFFPFTYGVDALRALWLGTESLFAMPLQLAVLAALGLVYLALGWWALGRFEQLSRHHGLEGF
jgi:ABC-2 type transport system permease protein